MRFCGTSQSHCSLLVTQYPDILVQHTMSLCVTQIDTATASICLAYDQDKQHKTVACIIAKHALGSLNRRYMQCRCVTLNRQPERCMRCAQLIGDATCHLSEPGILFCVCCKSRCQCTSSSRWGLVMSQIYSTHRDEAQVY